ncbi:MAG: ribosomal protein [Candidatus Saccharibacteria bacterium]|jgi:large subunit ribosomal protein L24|nr:ribosomal protein [Candidatus Saccharibacteria bacterium]
MKLRKEDKVIVITGRDKGKTGAVMRVLPKENQVVVENVNVVKRHTKPSQKQPRGGILEITKPIDVSKVMVLDPQSGKPARIGYEIKANGTKERIFKVSANHEKAAKKAEKTEKTDKKATKDEPKKAETKKAGKK